jgi:cell division protein FtsB
MTENQISEYTQKLLDRVVALTHEVDNLRTGYVLVRNRLNMNAEQLLVVTKRFADEEKLIEQFATLSTKAASITADMAILTKNEALIQCANTSHQTAKDLEELIAKFKQGHLDN